MGSIRSPIRHFEFKILNHFPSKMGDFDESKFAEWGYRSSFRQRKQSNKHEPDDFRLKRERKAREDKPKPTRVKPGPVPRKKVVIVPPSPSDEEVYHEEEPVYKHVVKDSSIPFNLPVARTKAVRSSGYKKRKTLTVESLCERIIEEIVQEVLDEPKMILPTQ
jgi:hypothetical protein